MAANGREATIYLQNQVKTRQMSGLHCQSLIALHKSLCGGGGDLNGQSQLHG